MGGFAGIGTGLAFATEFQKESTPHGHGFVSLANMYQHNTLEQIARMIETTGRRFAGVRLYKRGAAFLRDAS